VLLVTTAVLFAGGTQEETGPVTLKMWNTSEALANPITEEYIADFQAKHPEVTIEFSVFPWTELRTKLLAAIAAGEGPDQTQLDSPWIVEFEKADLLDQAPKSVVNDLDKNFIPIAKHLVSSPKATYGYPWWCFTNLLWKNQNIFEDTGVDVNVAVKTWDDLLQVSKKLVQRDADGNTITAGLGFENRLLFFTDFLYNNNAAVVGEDENGIPATPVKSTLNSSQAGEAFKFIYDAYNTHKVADAGLGWFGENFVQGKIGMTFGANWMYGWIRDASPHIQFTLSQLPTAGGQKGQLRCDGWIMVVAKYAKPRVKALSWEFLETYVSNSGWEMMEKAFAIPTRKDVIDDPRTKDIEQPWPIYATSLVDSGVTRVKPFVDGWEEMTKQVDPVLQQMQNGEIDWKQAQARSHKIVSDILAEKM
jgi:multiple sugar transport system substrate-binding protein